MKQMIERNFKFWFFEAQKAVGIMAGFGLAYTLLFNIIGHQNNNNYMQTIAIVFPLCLPMSYIRSYLPMLISFGSLRKESAYGVQIMNVLCITEMLILCRISEVLTSLFFDVGKMPFITVVGLAIIGIGVSQMIGAIGLKFSYKAVLIGMTILALAVAALAASTIISMSKGYMSFLTSESFNVILILGGIVLYVISIFVVQIFMKNYEVRNA